MTTQHFDEPDALAPATGLFWGLLFSAVMWLFVILTIALAVIYL